MTLDEVKVGMEFGGTDVAGYWVKVEGLDGEWALCRWFSCFNSGREKVKLTDLVNERLYKEIEP